MYTKLFIVTQGWRRDNVNLGSFGQHGRDNRQEIRERPGYSLVNFWFANEERERAVAASS